MQYFVLWFSHLKNRSLISRVRNIVKGEEESVDLRCQQRLETGSRCHFEMLFQASESQVREDVPAEKNQARSQESGSQKGWTAE